MAGAPAISDRSLRGRDLTAEAGIDIQALGSGRTMVDVLLSYKRSDKKIAEKINAPVYESGLSVR